MNKDTIAAIATPPGSGGVAMVRISGDQALTIAQSITQKKLTPRHAKFTSFYDNQGNVIDEGIVIFFKAPHSFTGEDVVELQGHGSQLIMDELLKNILLQSARMAKPGEFTERAFLNGKYDLIQAEAIADMIHANTFQAAQSALKSLKGEFSKKINELLEQLTQLRMFVEASIDFVDEDIDLLSEHRIIDSIELLLETIKNIRKAAYQGSLLNTGIQVVIAGLPNAGKSSLLNWLSGEEIAIVTSIAGTTRDVLRERINLDGLILHLIDTAGIRDTTDLIEQEGIKRARAELNKADVILWIYDATEQAIEPFTFPRDIPVIKIKNKIDLLSDKKETVSNNENEVAISIVENINKDQLKLMIKKTAGFTSEETSVFIARRRHLIALDKATHFIQSGLDAYKEKRSHELLADDLAEASKALGEITGAFSTDDLLGRIFSEFCIGK